MAEPLDDLLAAVFSEHALAEMQRRGLTRDDVQRVLAAPEQGAPVRPGRSVYQSRMIMGDRAYLLRVFVDIDRQPPVIVTVYRTSKIEKYWSAS